MEQATRAVYDGRLWFTTLGSSIAWALHLTFAYPLVGVTCRVDSLWALWALTAGTLAVAVAATGVGWYEARRLATPRTDVERRGHFMARVGFWLGVYSVFVILVESLPLVFNDPCTDWRLAQAGGQREAPGARAAGAARLEGTGGQGRFHFSLAPVPERPATGALFEVRTVLRDARTGQPLEGARVEVDATMPEHGHGMVTAPEHSEEGGGRYHTRGMKLHMPGRWSLRVRAVHAGQEDALALDWVQPARATP